MSKTFTATRAYLASMPRRFRRAFIRAIQKLTKSGSPVAYSTVFSVPPGFSFPEAFSLEELPGLLFCHVIRSASGDKVTACWVDEDHSRAYLKTFSTKTGMNTVALSAGPESEGAIVEVEYPETPWWKLWKKLEEYSIRELLIGLLAITGHTGHSRLFCGILCGPGCHDFLRRCRARRYC
jgi:hypothetical protein